MSTLNIHLQNFLASLSVAPHVVTQLSVSMDSSVTSLPFVPICFSSILSAGSETRLAPVSRSSQAEQKGVVSVAQRCIDQWQKRFPARAVDGRKTPCDLFVVW